MNNNKELVKVSHDMLNVLQKFQQLHLEYDMRPEDEMHEYAEEVDNIVDKATNLLKII